MPVTPRLLLAATLCFAVAMPALAQSGDPQNPETPTTTIHVNARSVVVNVVVTDKSNRAVTGLSKDDFQIFEDGKPRTVTYFERHTTPQQEPATGETSSSHAGTLEIPLSAVKAAPPAAQN